MSQQVIDVDDVTGYKNGRLEMDAVITKRYSLTKIFFRGWVVHVKQHLLGQTLQLIFRVCYRRTSLRKGNDS